MRSSQKKEGRPVRGSSALELNAPGFDPFADQRDILGAPGGDNEEEARKAGSKLSRMFRSTSALEGSGIGSMQKSREKGSTGSLGIGSPALDSPRGKNPLERQQSAQSWKKTGIGRLFSSSHSIHVEVVHESSKGYLDMYDEDEFGIDVDDSDMGTATLVPVPGWRPITVWESKKTERVYELGRPVFMKRFFDCRHRNFLGGTWKDPMVIFFTSENEQRHNFLIWKLDSGYFMDIHTSPLKLRDGIAKAQDIQRTLSLLKIPSYMKCRPEDFLEMPEIEPSDSDLTLLNLELATCQLFNPKKYKVGILYIKAGQTTEDEILGNVTHSRAFQEFLDFIGEPIKLMNFHGYNGGLDTHTFGSGEVSYYTKYQDNEIMFHVSTLLPWDGKDMQFVERKRHIGNDICFIAFIDSPRHSVKPDVLRSQFNHVVCSVRVEHRSGTHTEYCVDFLARDEVPDFGPSCCRRFWPKTDALRGYLLSRIIRAQAASMQVDVFAKSMRRFRWNELQKLAEKCGIELERGPSSSAPKSARGERGSKLVSRSEKLESKTAKGMERKSASQKELEVNQRRSRERASTTGQSSTKTERPGKEMARRKASFDNSIGELNEQTGNIRI
eukprot:Clim_evm1s70 gene=Clim_evmTU1s70